MNKFDIDSPYKDILILVNGFDLHLGLKSSFSHFFQKEVLVNGNFDSKCNNLLLFLIYLRFYYNAKPSNAFFRTVFNDDPNWMDVEGFIKKIATDSKMLDGIYDSMRYRSQKATYPIGSDTFKKLIGTFLNKLELPEDKYDNATIKTLLTDGLQDFENRFTNYLKNEIKDCDSFYEKQSNFVLHIFDSIDYLKEDVFALQVLNFNYTNNHLNLYSEANVHGTLDSKIVIGYDSTTAPIKDEDVFGLSNEWRKMDVEYDYNVDGRHIHSIVCYGHSLGEQDYPYFFNLFDSCDFIKRSRVTLYFCYSKFGDETTQRKELEKYKMNAAKLLNAYERYKNPNIQRNTIVTNLILAKRMFFVEIK